jgi:alpha-tubulin suppressor-like RCC1 family protein
VVAVGDNQSQQCDVGNWTDITQVAAGSRHTVGLKADGTVVAVGHNEYGECAVSDWTDITKIVASGYDTVGLKADGTVVATGDNSYGQLTVSGWIDIIQVAAGGEHTVGLKADDTVIAVGSGGGGQYTINNWTDITQVAAGTYHTVGRKADGTVVAAGPEIELAKWNLGVVEYTLTVSSTSGGSVDKPGDGMFSYNAGVTVRLIAKPEAGYRLVRWTGDIETIANVNAATTIIAMHGDYAITANFPLNWPLIGGIIGAVVAVGLVVFFFRGRRAAWTKKQRPKRAARRKH